jgi:small GTP-binding protein
MLGDCAVGKTSVLCRFSQRYFKPEVRSTIGVEFGTKAITIEGSSVKAQIWDTGTSVEY